MNNYTQKDFYDRFWAAESRLSHLRKASARVKEKEFRRLLRATVPHGGHVLDVGCGKAFFASSITCRYKVAACDQAEKTIRKLEKKYKSIDFFSADVTKDIYWDNVDSLYDAVTCMDVIEHVPYDLQANLLKNIAAVLKPSGYLIISTPDRKVSLTYKNTPHEDDDDFLRRLEGQPIANQLTASQLDKKLSQFFQVKYRTGVVPAVHNRGLDLLWKGLGMMTGYAGINGLTHANRMPGKYLIRLAVKKD